MKVLRIAAVPYWNIEPFLRALTRLVPCEVERAAPSALPALRESGRFDLCMLSAADLLRAGEDPLDGACIASDGPVGSVFLSSEMFPAAWRLVGLDAASSTSAELARIVLKHLLGLSPAFRRVDDPDGAIARRECDAILRIGDRALRMPAERVHLDLGEAWRRLAGAPFVYAAWVPGPGRAASRATLEAVLRAARDRSGREAPGAAEDGARALGIDASVLRRYYSEQIRYAFDARARRGLALFGSMLPPARVEREAPRRPLREVPRLAGGLA
jgi:predicted solute-binding protein